MSEQRFLRIEERLRDADRRVQILERKRLATAQNFAGLQLGLREIDPTEVLSPCCNHPIKTTLVLIGPGRYNSANVALNYNFGVGKWIGADSSYRWEFNCDGDTQPNFELRVFSLGGTLIELQSEPPDCGPPFLWTDRDSIRD